MSVTTQSVALFAVSVSGRTLTPVGNVAINDLRPRTAVGSLTLTGIVNGAVFDVYVQSASNNQYSLLALPAGTSVSGRTDVALIGQVIDSPTTASLLWIPSPGGSSSPFLYVASDGVHFKVIQTTGQNEITIESPSRLNDLILSTTDSSSHVTCAFSLDLIGGNSASFQGGGVLVYADTTLLELRAMTSVVIEPGGGSGANFAFDSYAHTISTQPNRPTVVANNGAGVSTGGTALVVSGSTDQDGMITVATGTAPSGANTAIATVTFQQSFSSTPKRVIVQAANANALNLAAGQQCAVLNGFITTASWILTSGVTALAPSTTYQWWYSIMG